MDPYTAMIVAQAMQQKVNSAKPKIRIAAIAVISLLLGSGVYFAVRASRKKKWMDRMDENDVRVAALFITLVGPKKLADVIKSAILTKLKYLNPTVGITIDIAKKAWEWASGDGSSLYKSCEAGVYAANDWTAVQEAYEGMARRSLNGDLAKKLTADEFQKLMALVETRKKSAEDTKVRVDSARSAMVAKVYESAAKAKVGTIYTMRNGGQFKSWKMAGFLEPTFGYEKPKVGGKKTQFSKGDFVGNPTTRFVKVNAGGREVVLLEISTSAGPRWFVTETLTIWK